MESSIEQIGATMMGRKYMPIMPIGMLALDAITPATPGILPASRAV